MGCRPQCPLPIVSNVFAADRGRNENASGVHHEDYILERLRYRFILEGLSETENGGIPIRLPADLHGQYSSTDPEDPEFVSTGL
jgi:hypothetical protein